MTFDRLRIAAQTRHPLGAAMKQGGLGALRGYEAIGIDQMIFVSKARRNRHDAADNATRERVAPAIERALARRSLPREAPGDYAIRSSMKV
ncbi:MAG: hypothetical protein NTZ61_03285 [Proteobacteria bacterium]|nr:hypothetical protein [Pseudomonadota bacterium]